MFPSEGSSELCELLFGANAVLEPDFEDYSEDELLPILYSESFDYSSSTMSNSADPGLTILPIYIVSLLIVLLIYKYIKQFLVDNESRNCALIGCFGSMIGTALICMFCVFGMFGNENAAKACFLCAIPSLITIDISRTSCVRAEGFSMTSKALGSVLTFIFSPSIPLTLIYHFPPSQFTECNQAAVDQQLKLVFMFAAYAAGFFSANYHFWTILLAERLLLLHDFQPIGYLVKNKKSVWVKVESPPPQLPRRRVIVLPFPNVSLLMRKMIV